VTTDWKAGESNVICVHVPIASDVFCTNVPPQPAASNSRKQYVGGAGAGNGAGAGAGAGKGTGCGQTFGVQLVPGPCQIPGTTYA
jgi:hypothetical protein